MNQRCIFTLLSLYLVNIQLSKAQNIYPQDNWKAIANIEDLGWSQRTLNDAKLIADSIGSDAVMIVYRGAILKAWGEIDRKFMCHSMRKSLLSAIIGLYVDNEEIKLQKTLAELEIEDTPNELTKLEKTATIEHLLSSRSGIYLPAAYEWPTRKPARGKFNPGEKWFYPNNWDYNALLTIYEQETGKKLFEDFYNSFAVPLNMNDYEISDGYYHYEKHKSSHPAYPFRMSARDLARIGLLFLREGKWENKQIISKNWIEKSVAPISQTYAEGEGYGFLWWIDNKNFPYGYYSAEGTGGHGVIVVPALELIIVHRVNTYIDKRISYRQRGRLISKIMEAYSGEGTNQTIQLLDFKPSLKSKPNNFIQLEHKQAYVGKYSIEKYFDFESDSVEVYLNSKDKLEIFIPYKGYFEMNALSETLFLLEDSQEYVTFLLDEEGQPQHIIYHRNSRVGKKK